MYPDAPRPAVSLPECPDCGGTGLVSLDVPLADPRFGKAFPCPNPDCPARKSNEQTRAAHLFRDSGLVGEQAIFRLDDPFYRAARFDRVRRGIDLLLKKRSFGHQGHRFSGLWLEGPVGAGKSGIAAASVTAANARGIAGRFQGVKELLDWLRAGFGKQDGQDFDARLDALRRVPWLVLDDFGAHNATPWAIAQVEDVLNARYVNRAQGLVTIITSNKPIDDVADELNAVESWAGWRIRSRVRGMCLPLRVKGPDGRAPGFAQQMVLEEVDGE